MFVQVQLRGPADVNSGFYSACAALVAQIHSLDVAAHNLANISTAGFRSQHPTFRSVLLTRRGTGAAAGLNEFAAVAGDRVDFQPGRVEHTGNNLDVALDGPGFLAVETRGGTRYTRDGRLQLSRDGVLVNIAGDPVLGQRGPLRIPPGQVNISGDGTVSVDGAIVDRLQIAEFVSTESLRPTTGSYFAADEAEVRPSTATQIRQQALESSNVDSIAAAIGLVALQRHAEMMQRAMSIFHSDFNRIAAEDIARV
jgi:flagellar basal-body rod protein FlgF/flagellar basal-body rod protein FlgG